jgi:hypothetical protein
MSYRPEIDKKATRQFAVQMFANDLRPTEAAELVHVSSRPHRRRNGQRALSLSESDWYSVKIPSSRTTWKDPAEGRSQIEPFFLQTPHAQDLTFAISGTATENL